MAAAHASGVVALLLAEGLTRDQVVQRVISTLRPMACGAGCQGLLDAAAAVGASAAGAPLVGGASRAAPAAAAAARPPASLPSAMPAPSPAPSAPTTTQAPPETALPEGGREAAGVARDRSLGAAETASAGGIAQSPGAVWAAIALMAGTAIGLALRVAKPRFPARFLS
jgi:hypothetical protein